MYVPVNAGDIFCDKLNFIYIEMPKFNKTEEELETHFDKWLFAIKNLYKLDDIPGKLQEKIFERFFEIAEIAQMNPEERTTYENSLKYYRDMNNVVETAKDEGWEAGIEKGIAKGKAEGLAEGKAEGKKEQAIDIAKKLLDLLDSETIAEKTGLTVSEIESLKQDNS